MRCLSGDTAQITVGVPRSCPGASPGQGDGGRGVTWLPGSRCPWLGCGVRQLGFVQGPAGGPLLPTLPSQQPQVSQINRHLPSLGHLAACVSGRGCVGRHRCWRCGSLPGDPCSPGLQTIQTHGHVGAHRSPRLSETPGGRWDKLERKPWAWLVPSQGVTWGRQLPWPSSSPGSDPQTDTAGCTARQRTSGQVLGERGRGPTDRPVSGNSRGLCGALRHFLELSRGG